MERSFFEHVLDAFEGFVDDGLGEPQCRWHRRGIKVWFGPSDGRAAREHYEAQLIRVDGEAALEIGFHAEYPSEDDNQDALDRLDGRPSWRTSLGEEAEAGPFLGMDGWRRISEVWEPPDPDDPEAPIEVAARLADYVDAIEPLRRATLTP
ncbi:MAG: hypothetical protein R2707_19365 [Acidimicrobiales bacterium]